MKLLVFIVGLSLSFNINADQYWSPLSLQSKNTDSVKFFQLNVEQLKQDLSNIDNQENTIISLPREDGSLSQFYIWQTSVVTEEITQKYPNFKTYRIKHITDSSIRGRMELMNDSLSAMIKTPSGKEFITLHDQWDQVYQAKSQPVTNVSAFSCGTIPSNKDHSLGMKLPEIQQQRPSINQLTRLRVAIATTAEYSAEFGSTKADVLAEIIIAINRINDVFETELAIHLDLIGTNEDIIFIGNDPFTNSTLDLNGNSEEDGANFDSFELIDEGQLVIDNVIGSGHYDLGHVFSTGAGGLASVGAVCITGNKANGVTGNTSPTSDSFWIDFVAHEMGHQLGAEHTFNGSSQSCSGGNRVANNAYEPGSGSTIMAYAGICFGENLQSNSDDSFHSKSIFEIDNTIPSSCGVDEAYSSIHSGDSNGNNPTVIVGADKKIPIKTPFVLSASASDLDGDDLYYQWDGADKGTATTSNTIGCDLKDNALFRSNKPKQESVRYFPSMETLLSGNKFYGETLPTTSRDINFTVKVTDGKSGYATEDIKLTSSTVADAFKVTSQTGSNSYDVGDLVTVTWDASNTTEAPINCSSVDVQLLNFSNDKSTFSTQTLSSGEPNFLGSAQVFLPSDGNSSFSRFLVKCSDNVFFAINEAYFSISAGTTNATNNEISTSGGIKTSTASRVNSALECPYDSNGNSSGSGEFSVGGGGLIPWWILYVFSFLLVARRRI